MGKFRIFPLVTGYLDLDLGTYVFLKGDAGKHMEVPVICFLVETPEELILVDTGMPDVERAKKYHHPAKLHDGLPVHEGIKKLGFSPLEVSRIIFTHLHWDHCGNLKQFPKARRQAHVVEWKFANNPLPPYYKSYEAEALGIEPTFKGLDFDLNSGELKIMDGLWVFPSPGHCPGHQCVAVKTENAVYVLAGDATILRKSFEPHPTENWEMWPPARFMDIEALWSSMVRIKQVTENNPDYILLSHEPGVLEIACYE